VLSACNGVTQVLNNAGPCSDLVPREMWEPVPGAPLPPITATVGEREAFANKQTNNLDDANEKPPAIRHSITGCEARDQRITNSLTARWYEFWK